MTCAERAWPNWGNNIGVALKKNCAGYSFVRTLHVVLRLIQTQPAKLHEIFNLKSTLKASYRSKAEHGNASLEPEFDNLQKGEKKAETEFEALNISAVMEKMVFRLDITRIFCEVDDFCQSFEKHWQAQALLTAIPGGRRSTSRMAI